LEEVPEADCVRQLMKSLILDTSKVLSPPFSAPMRYINNQSSIRQIRNYRR
jgi:hypothetical protein